MFDYSRAASRKIKKDLDKIALCLNLVTQLLSIVYLVYILLYGSGAIYVKLALLVLSGGYFLFFCATSIRSTKKVLRRKVKLTVQWSKRLIKIVNLGIIIYGFVNSEQTTFSLLLLAFSIVSWALDLIIGIVSFIFTSWLQLFFLGVETDLEEFKKTVTTPFTATGNFFKRMTGREVEEEEKPEPSEKRKFLTAMVIRERKARIEKKEEEQRRRQQKRVDAKEAKRAEKIAAKAAKKERKSLDEEESAFSLDDPNS